MDSVVSGDSSPDLQAEKSLIGKGNKEYLPIQGLAAFNKATAELLLGPDSPAIKEVRFSLDIL